MSDKRGRPRGRVLERPRWPLGPGRPTLGPQVAAWLERNLVHGPGDRAGEPYRLLPWCEDVINQVYELRPDGSRRYDRVLVGVAKGNGKTELAAALAIAELCGPVAFAGWRPDGSPLPGRRRVSPDIPAAANSYEQADLLYGAAAAMIRGGPLAEYIEVYDAEALLRGAPGRLYRVPAIAATVDGCRPTFVVFDELHEFAGPRERVYRVLEAGRGKRQGSWSLAITTAGWDPASLLGQLYAHGRRVLEGTEQDPGLLMIWYEAPADLDLTQPAELERAIRLANPALGASLALETLLRQYQSLPEHEFRRYHLNQWTSAPAQWIAPDVWTRATRVQAVPDGASIVLGFDGSLTRDSTALVGCTLTNPPHLFVLGCWERPAQAREWVVPRAEVLDAILAAHERWRVVRFGFDDTFGRAWQLDLEALRAEGVEVVNWPTRHHSRMGPAAAAFLGALTDGRLTHDGDPRFMAHALHAVGKATRWGVVPTKETPDSRRHIDLLVAAIIAHDLAGRSGGERVPWLLAVIEAPEPRW